MCAAAGGGESPDSGVGVVPYRDDWPALFEVERSALAELTGPAALSIEHIGSTAVSGLSSKPTIDILMVVNAPAAFLERLPHLEAVGYRHSENSFASEDHLFLRKIIGGKRISDLHVLRAGSPEIAEYRLFRESLRTDAELATRLGQYKLDMASRYAADRPSYVSKKEIWVSEVLEQLQTRLERCRGSSPGKEDEASGRVSGLS